MMIYVAVVVTIFIIGDLVRCGWHTWAGRHPRPPL